VEWWQIVGLMILGGAIALAVLYLAVIKTKTYF
jgi:hypothetical protein